MLEQLFTNIGVILQKFEVDMFYKKIAESGTRQRTPSYQDFLEFCIRESIEVMDFDEGVNFVHPTVISCIDKI